MSGGLVGKTLNQSIICQLIKAVFRATYQC